MYAWHCFSFINLIFFFDIILALALVGEH